MTARRTPRNKGLTHVAPDGSARMVDVSDKPPTRRTARAKGRIRMNKEAFEAIRSHAVAKGDVLSTARIAGIMAAKKTSDLVPLCHPLLLDDVRVDLTVDPDLPGVSAQSVVTTMGRTGVEMEAIVAVTVALVTVYDMVKGLDRSMTVSDISLVEKTGGQGDPYFAR